VPVFVALAVGITLTLAAAGHPAAASEPLTVDATRALVVSPHPDDATLAAGGLIQRLLRQGASVDVVQMTGGDGFPKGVTALHPGVRPNPDAFRRYGSLREQEAVRALHALGVRRSAIRPLGFPDEGLCLLAAADSRQPIASPYTGRDSPPESERLIPSAMYRRDDLLGELTRLIEEIRPTLLVVPHSGDEHPDHCATHLLVHQALAAAVARGVPPPRVLHYILHYPAWPDARTAAGDTSIAPPAGGHAGDWTWRTLPLTPAERAGKSKALDIYRSQMLVMPDFLKSFERSNELFLEGEPASPFPCWCNGDNISTHAIGR
jgi:LmbE family N-acetylglucosaminyl deacetylase